MAYTDDSTPMWISYHPSIAKEVGKSRIAGTNKYSPKETNYYIIEAAQSTFKTVKATIKYMRWLSKFTYITQADLPPSLRLARKFYLFCPKSFKFPSPWILRRNN